MTTELKCGRLGCEGNLEPTNEDYIKKILNQKFIFKNLPEHYKCNACEKSSVGPKGNAIVENVIEKRMNKLEEEKNKK